MIRIKSCLIFTKVMYNKLSHLVSEAVEILLSVGNSRPVFGHMLLTKSLFHSLKNVWCLQYHSENPEQSSEQCGSETKGKKESNNYFFMPHCVVSAILNLISSSLMI